MTNTQTGTAMWGRSEQGIKYVKEYFPEYEALPGIRRTIDTLTLEEQSARDYLLVPWAEDLLRNIIHLLAHNPEKPLVRRMIEERMEISSETLSGKLFLLKELDYVEIEKLPYTGEIILGTNGIAFLEEALPHYKKHQSIYRNFGETAKSLNAFVLTPRQEEVLQALVHLIVERQKQPIPLKQWEKGLNSRLQSCMKRFLQNNGYITTARTNKKTTEVGAFLADKSVAYVQEKMPEYAGSPYITVVPDAPSVQEITSEFQSSVLSKKHHERSPARKPHVPKFRPYDLSPREEEALRELIFLLAKRPDEPITQKMLQDRMIINQVSAEIYVDMLHRKAYIKSAPLKYSDNLSTPHLEITLDKEGLQYAANEIPHYHKLPGTGRKIGLEYKEIPIAEKAEDASASVLDELDISINEIILFDYIVQRLAGGVESNLSPVFYEDLLKDMDHVFSNRKEVKDIFKTLEKADLIQSYHDN